MWNEVGGEDGDVGNWSGQVQSPASLSHEVGSTADESRGGVGDPDPCTDLLPLTAGTSLSVSLLTLWKEKNIEPSFQLRNKCMWTCRKILLNSNMFLNSQDLGN